MKNYVAAAGGGAGCCRVTFECTQRV